MPPAIATDSNHGFAKQHCRFISCCLQAYAAFATGCSTKQKIIKV
jgi:hypothetical protein